MVTKGWDLAACGRFDEGMELIQKGFKYNHHHAEWYFWYQGMAYFAAGQFEAAVESFKRMSEQNKDTRIYLAACYAQLDDISQAQKIASELFEKHPETTLKQISDSHLYLRPEIKGTLMTGIERAMGEKTPTKKLHLV